MTDHNAWLASIGLPPLPAAPVVTVPASPRSVVMPATRPSTPAHTSRARHGGGAGHPPTPTGTVLARVGALALDQLARMPTPSQPMVGCLGLVRSPLHARQVGRWRILSDPRTVPLGLALAISDGSTLTLGLWTPQAVDVSPAQALGPVARWHGSTCPEPVLRAINLGAAFVAPTLVVAQAVYRGQGWLEPVGWHDLAVLLGEANRNADLDEIAAWLAGAAPEPLVAGQTNPRQSPAVAAWNGLNLWPGLIVAAPDERLNWSGQATTALAAARVGLGVGARLGAELPTESEDRGWDMDQAVNLRGLPFDRAAATEVVALAAARGVEHLATKVKEVITYACTDDTVRGAYRYADQHHGRWTSAEPGIHNLRKTTWSRARLRAIWRALKNGRLRRCLDHIPMPVLEDLLANLERGLFVAPAGQVFVVADQNAAEPRRVFQVAGRRDVLAVMQNGDLYLDPSLQRMLFGDSVPKGHPDAARRRLVLKIMVIACGYGMSADTLATYASKGWGVDLAAQGVTAEAVISAYRGMFPEVGRLWKTLTKASVRAVRDRAVIETAVGTFRMEGSDLHLVLPSQRPIVYPDAVVTVGKFNDDVLGYRRGGPLTGILETAWGGTLLNHATCGMLRDIHVHHLAKLESEGFPVVGHTHDEAVLLVPEERGPEAVERMRAVMGVAPWWANELPLKVGPYLTERLGAAGLER